MRSDPQDRISGNATTDTQRWDSLIPSTSSQIKVNAHHQAASSPVTPVSCHVMWLTPAWRAMAERTHSHLCSGSSTHFSILIFLQPHSALVLVNIHGDHTFTVQHGLSSMLSSSKGHSSEMLQLLRCLQGEAQ